MCRCKKGPCGGGVAVMTCATVLWGALGPIGHNFVVMHKPGSQPLSPPTSKPHQGKHVQLPKRRPKVGKGLSPVPVNQMHASNSAVLELCR